VTDVQRSYLTNLLVAGRATLYALERAIRHETAAANIAALATECDAIRTDVNRLELVLGV
jgi:hypothetical protein